jgi:UDP-2,4-diacetamido-2,4,6-trideoxy-beta-L-altropyranose hydrolase
VFRADGGPGTGMGHLVRSAALAEELRRRGWATWLASRAMPTSFAEQQEASGCGLIPLAGDQEAEFATMSRMLGARSAWVVLDHYGLGADWLQGARRITEARLVLDDLRDRKLECEIVVNPWFVGGRGAYAELAPGARLLLGPAFALVRSEFLVARGSAPARSFDAVRRILISLGGTDPEGATGRVIDEVLTSAPWAEVDVLLGHATRTARVPATDRVHVYVDPPDVPALMLAADLAVGAGGGMTWERCAIGLPSLIVAVADNQREQSEMVAASGAARYLGPLAALEPGAIAAAVAGVLEADVRGEMARCGQALVDGLGCVRVADQMEGVSLRPATGDDARRVWEIANDPAVRLASISTDSIPWESHRRWFTARLASGEPLLVAEIGSRSVGYVRFDDRPDGTEVSMALDPRHRGGLGGRVLRTACDWWDAVHPGTRLLARIKTDNQASLRAFLGSGFVEEGSERGIVTLARPGHPLAAGDSG